LLAVPFSAHKDVAKQLKTWDDKIVVDVTNAMHVAPEDLGGLLSSELVSQAFGGARIVKAFNHLPADQLGANARQAVLVSSNDTKRKRGRCGLSKQAWLLSSGTRKARQGRCASSFRGR
jgi:8-hydroxy-5-deazaflavin:NADPH oxidoreductase